MYEFKVKGMTCPSCARKMRTALLFIDPNVEVSVDLVSQTVRVKSDQPEEEISSLIEDAGYPVIEGRKIERSEAI